MFGWLRNRDSAGAHELLPPPDLFAATLDRFPALSGLAGQHRERLRQLAGQLLDRWSFHGAGGLEPGYEDCLAVATLAALPMLSRGLDGYSALGTIILQPRAFEVEVEEADEHGIVHTGRDLRSGEAWESGPVVLALEDVWESGQRQGYNVVVHELAHVLDHANPDGEGLPLLSPGVDPREWAREFTSGFERLRREAEVDEEPFIDPYGAESPAEFFAVLCEYFFDWPEHLRAEAPVIYRLLAAQFAQDPATRLAGLDTTSPGSGTS